MGSEAITHVAIIMDGNGRWATARHEQRNFGHLRGTENVHDIAIAAHDQGIRILSLYAFSTENWRRPLQEVNYLMKLPALFFERYLNELMERDIRVVSTGNLADLPEATRRVLEKAIDQTKHNQAMILNFCMNYGSQAEIARAARLYAAEVAAGDRANDLSVDEFSRYLYHDFPPVDLMIRTSGELRLSNFMLWQNAYAEFIFVQKAWPEFSGADLQACLDEFHQRQRRYGGLQ